MAEDKAKNDEDEGIKRLYWDIVVLLAPWLPRDHVTKLFSESLEMTKVDNATIQKKAWRIMEQIAAADNEICKTVMDDSISLIVEQMMVTLSSCAASARKPRLQLLGTILHRIENTEFLKKITTELVICTKDHNAISRALAFKLLSGICQKLVDENTASKEEGILEFFQIILQGLTGTPIMVSCALNVLTCTMFEFRTLIPDAVHAMILENVLLLMTSAAREILKSTVSFLITLTKTLSAEGLAPHLERILTAVVNWKPETRNPFRLKVRRLLERLVKKFGFDIVQKFIPDKSPIAKMLANAKKIQKRNERKKEENRNENDDDDEDEEELGPAENLEDLIKETDSEEESDEEVEKKQKRKKKRRLEPMIEEEGDDVQDMLSPAFVGNLTTKKNKKGQHPILVNYTPKGTSVSKERRAEDDDEIGTAPDGRIIVRELKNKKVDVDMLSSDEEGGIPENIKGTLRISDQKVSQGLPLS